MIGTLHVVDDVPATFARITRSIILDSTASPFVLACSGGSSGIACFTALAEVDIPWSNVEILFVDERCVPWDTPEANGYAIGLALGRRVTELSGFHRMSCDEGPEPYGTLLASLGKIDLVQLGLGPDGHFASLFPESNALIDPSGSLVARNFDPSGQNPYDRITMTISALKMARRTLVTVIGADKHDAFAAIAKGESVPGALVDSQSTTWIVDRSTTDGPE